ncbi:MAG TPA: hybrid sensor histidine kinase/response regulator [Bacteroidales bacterium]|nr:hybrid sensor histidine kinase/response regulator [Bacteroidales bacterium]
MGKEDNEFLKRIQATFRIEAEEHLHAISAGLIELEKTPSKEKVAEIIEVMFRKIHSLKGAARSVDQKDIEYVCQPLESIFSSLKRGEITLSPLSFDLFYKTVEWLSKHIAISESEQTGTFRQSRQELIQRLKEIASEKSFASALQEPSAAEIESTHLPQSDPVSVTEPGADLHGNLANTQVVMARIPMSKLDPLLLQAEEMIQAKMAINQQTDELKELIEELNEWKTETQKWRGRKAAATPELWKELCDTGDMRLNKVEGRITELTRSMERHQHSLDRLVNDHLEAMKQVLMLPVGSLVEAFPGMVRKISHEQNKEIDFIISGTELEIDKRILEELKDPLIHLIRNSIDHGIGKPQERVLQNKPFRGNITLAFAAKESGQVEITLADDGKGIDKEHVLKAAIKSGIISNEDAGKLEPKEVLNLIYQSGVSTSSIITDISGHGLGLSIVQEKVLKLNGKISVDSEENAGTTFRILLPMTLATFRGILVMLQEFMFILPATNVERVIKVEKEEIKTVENHETIRIDDQIISVADLGKVLGLPGHKHAGQGKMEPGSANSNQIRIVVLVSGEDRIAFKVDDLVDELQVLVKGLGKLLRRVRNISGVTILASGKVVPVLNIPDLMKSAVKTKGRKSEVSAGELFVPKPGKILVAEDSITSRTLIKNILETAGYQVTTSVDGADAFTKARTGDFDIVVSDVDMPKMNGFELTAKIRSDKKLSEIPVVLVTALESREDREHGIEVGADAYIIKSSFDQTNLLEIIKKLI